jgi:GTPase
LQVELAQLEYRLPRLTGMWTHLSRQAVGGVGLRGPGETQLESDRRELGKRIGFIKEQLSDVHRHRQLYRDHRRQQNMPVVALVGYTNAGKSTLLNRLTGAGVLAEDKLFATLDPTTRRIELPGGRNVLLTDTVGFINNLPTTLIAAFRATLEEINEATVLVHVADITHPNAREQFETVNLVLEELGADGKPTVMALNKEDLLDGQPAGTLAHVMEIVGTSVPSVLVSGKNGSGLENLLAEVERVLEAEQNFVAVQVKIPFARSELVDRFHQLGRVEEIRYDERGTILLGLLPETMISSFAPYLTLKGAAGIEDRSVTVTSPESAA